jgi:hypothetical protein
VPIDFLFERIKDARPRIRDNYGTCYGHFFSNATVADEGAREVKRSLSAKSFFSTSEQLFDNAVLVAFDEKSNRRRTA